MSCQELLLLLKALMELLEHPALTHSLVPVPVPALVVHEVGVAAPLLPHLQHLGLVQQWARVSQHFLVKHELRLHLYIIYLYL